MQSFSYLRPDYLHTSEVFNLLDKAKWEAELKQLWDEADSTPSYTDKHKRAKKKIAGVSAVIREEIRAFDKMWQQSAGAAEDSSDSLSPPPRRINTPAHEPPSHTAPIETERRQMPPPVGMTTTGESFPN
ncbi:hypothetical protein F5X97DRAFT_329770 [Nemania serpens]|nr:hypothetical protein F5X97DRAFT_329770 [Nemania serpens]